MVMSFTARLTATAAKTASRRCTSVLGFQQRSFGSLLTTSVDRAAASLRKVPSVRTFVSSTTVLRDDDLPYHLVVGMPALSPTMESGVLAEWYVKVGDSISAGDAIAKIETDKAAMDFEAQDDAYIAKLLVDPSLDDSTWNSF